MSLIEKLTERLKRHPKRVVFAEGSDPRIIQAARQYATARLGAPILLGDRTEIKENAARLDISLDGVRVIDPSRSEDLDSYIKKLSGHKKFRDMSEEEVRNCAIETSYFGTLMLATSSADALVTGATIRASSALRPLIQIIPMQDDVKTVSSMLIMEISDTRYGEEGLLFLADCGVIPDPDENQLADIALTTASLAHNLTNIRPKVAMLSYTTKARRTQLPVTSKMLAATALAKEKIKNHPIEADIDGEMQADAALDKITAKQKGLDSSVAGQANILIFPDLSSGNIAAKMVQIIGGARSYGQIITGLKKPAGEISRGASAHDIFGVAVITAAQAIDKNYLYVIDPEEFN